MKKLLLKIYYFGNNSKDKIEYYQKIIRDVEWLSVVDFIPEKSSFLDIGCGAGYSMNRAIIEKQCIVSGIDPEPYIHGVGRQWNENNVKETVNSFKILKGYGESLPYHTVILNLMLFTQVTFLNMFKIKLNF